MDAQQRHTLLLTRARCLRVKRWSLSREGPAGRGLGAGGRSGGSGGMAAQHGRNFSLTAGMYGGWCDCFSGAGGVGQELGDKMGIVGTGVRSGQTRVLKGREDVGTEQGGAMGCG